MIATVIVTIPALLQVPIQAMTHPTTATPAGPKMIVTIKSPSLSSHPRVEGGVAPRGRAQHLQRIRLPNGDRFALPPNDPLRSLPAILRPSQLPSPRLRHLHRASMIESGGSMARSVPTTPMTMVAMLASLTPCKNAARISSDKM